MSDHNFLLETVFAELIILNFYIHTDQVMSDFAYLRLRYPS